MFARMPRKCGLPAIKALVLVAAFLAVGFGSSACQRSTTPAGATPADAANKASDPGTDKPGSGDAAEDRESAVKLTQEQTDKLGVETKVAEATEHVRQAPGYGVVVSHEVIAQVAAELETAQANERLSHSALLRAQKLAGTPGAVSTDLQETAAQKAEVDAAALTLTAHKVSATLGMRPPWNMGAPSATLRELASGKVKLVRATFPFGNLRGAVPKRLKAGRIGAGEPEQWTLTDVWDAPADATLPGRSFFALLREGDAGEGERLQVWAATGKPQEGVIVPASAAVMSESKFWCYVEKEPGTFSRVEIDTSLPTEDGYFVSAGVSPGDKIVTTAAGQLLAKETGSGAEPD
jgi:hypothetical protein